MRAPLDTFGALCTDFYEQDSSVADEASLAFYAAYAAQADGLILEPMCGTGSYLLPLLKAGYPVHGFDASPSMLAILRAKASDRGLHPHVWLAHVEDLDLFTRYALIVIPNCSINLLTDAAQLQATLGCLAKLLEPGGKLVFEMEVRAPVDPGSEPWTEERPLPGGNERILLTANRQPFSDGIERTTCRYELFDGLELTRTEVEEFEFRSYEAATMRTWLLTAGFAQIRTLNADTGEPPEALDERVVFEATR